MRKIKFYISSVIVVLGLLNLNTGCNDFFQEPIEANINQDTIFNSMINAEKLLNSAYDQVPYLWPTNAFSNSTRNLSRIKGNITATICDEGVTGSVWNGARVFYYGDAQLSADNVGKDAPNIGKDPAVRYQEHIFEEPYKLFNRAFTYIEGVSNTRGASSEFVKTTRAQAQMLNAIGYFEMIKRYGSVPWVGKALTPNDNPSEERPPLADIIQRVDDMIMEALPNLPESYNDANQGRVTRASAYFLRSRLWLWAASPLFNADAPYMQMDNPANNNLIWMGGYDASLWQKAADVTREAIQYCEGAGYTLVNTGQPIEDYTLATREVFGNTEAILFSRRVANFNNSKSASGWYGRFLPPRDGANNNGAGWNNPTQNIISMYETIDGAPINYRAENPWATMEPRFQASIVHDKADFGGLTINANIYNSMDAPAVSPKSNNLLVNGWITGFYMRKFMHEDLQTANTNLRYDAPYIYMRLPELYLNYAEALNEADPGNGDIVTNLNKIRIRAGVTPLAAASQDVMREMIRKERAIEMIFEDQRFFDVKRWKIAAETIGATKFGVHRINEDDVANGVVDESGVPYEFGDYMIKECPTTVQRIWKDKLYLMPFPRYEINKGKGLVQNPGY
ncbi:RagB/SusD family nutrient uptake outer membrane protein [Carboxylicivirga sp. M1479]|uniref:RagB/SusD family nutrient uptake outer membrane protein n=1 Tax=Carboxylicivirga sp. M1479 TaxID=2594476 RepID=UPI0011786FD8|nr:RagB/SusD family nutrient uptake outer membrane protein [Carboxylicivirga sp. M1479]TRX66283.1 RagB/SusD family nutrient uptake outer membrane protein [Carboxylicivirga sp. M1479]